MQTEFIVKGPKSKTPWRTTPEDKVTITRHLKKGTGEVKIKRKRKIVHKTRDVSLYGRWRLTHTPSVQTSPLTILDGGRIDPFITYPVPDAPVTSRAIIDHALSFTWPSIVPVQGKDLSYPVQAAWLEHLQKSPASFYAYQYCGVAHKALLKEGPYGLVSSQSSLLELKAKALQHLKQECAAIQDAAPDHLLTTIIALGAHEIHPRALEFANHQYARSAMAKTQTLNVISNMTFVPAHMQILYALVAQRGGLKEIKGYGVAPTIALADLLAGTISVTRPRLDCYWSPDSIEVSQVEYQEMELETFGKNFEVLDDHLKEELDEFYRLLPRIRQVTVQIARYHQTAGKAPPLSKIVNLRNYVQWQLLSLPNLTLSIRDAKVGKVGNAVVIAALIFSNLVTLPLGPALGHQDIHSNALKAALELGPRCNAILSLWLLTMGGIAAEYSSRRKWYVSKFREMADKLCTSSKPFFLETMRGFLWWDGACTPPAMDFWSSALASNAIDEKTVAGRTDRRLILAM